MLRSSSTTEGGHEIVEHRSRRCPTGAGRWALCRRRGGGGAGPPPPPPPPPPTPPAAPRRPSPPIRPRRPSRVVATDASLHGRHGADMVRARHDEPPPPLPIPMGELQLAVRARRPTAQRARPTMASRSCTTPSLGALPVMPAIIVPSRDCDPPPAPRWPCASSRRGTGLAVILRARLRLQQNSKGQCSWKCWCDSYNNNMHSPINQG